MSTAEQGRRRVAYFAIFLAALFGAIAFLDFWSSRDDLREGSRLVSETGQRMEIGDIPKRYRAIFRYENRARELKITHEKVWVNRPFESRIESYAEKIEGDPTTVRQSNFGVLASVSEGSGEPLNIAVPPSLASGDIRPDAVLDEAVKGKVLLVREQREVFGRRCQVYRAGGSMLAGDIPRYEPGKGEYADVCIDRNGIVIEEYWVENDKLLRRRVATDLDVDVSIPSSLFRIDVPATPGLKRGAVERIPSNASVDGTPLWTLRRPPEGFDRLGRYAVVMSPDAVPSLGGERPPVGPSSTTDVYVRGPDLVVIDQDPSLATLVSFENRPTVDVKLERLVDAELVLDARQSEVRGRTGDGSYVRVIGTVATEELLDLADRLRPTRE
jgi:hypothetical protein